VEEAHAEPELTLVIGCLDEFTARVRDGLGELNFAGKQPRIRTLVRRIEIDRNHVEAILLEQFGVAQIQLV
jgi:site-specific DNA recombinase